MIFVRLRSEADCFLDRWTLQRTSLKTAKAFPTVGDAIVGCFTKCCRKKEFVTVSPLTSKGVMLWSSPGT